jgi:hypothetical protein
LVGHPEEHDFEEINQSKRKWILSNQGNSVVQLAQSYRTIVSLNNSKRV